MKNHSTLHDRVSDFAYKIVGVEADTKRSFTESLLSNSFASLGKGKVVVVTEKSRGVPPITEISRNTKKSYNLIFDFDDLREIFFNTFRNQGEINNRKYYFSAFNGNTYELELLIDENFSSIPKSLENLKYLNRLYLYINNLGLEMPRFDVCIESLKHLKIFCFGQVRLPNIFINFPNLKSLEISGDISGLTHLEIDNKAMESLNQIKHNLKNVIIKMELL